MSEDAAPPTPLTESTVEEVVRARLAEALGGRRGIAEAAVPTVIFTVVFLTSHQLRLALILAVGCAVLLLAVRLVQRSSPQFVVNALFGIGLGALFAWRAGRAGGDASDQALAYFLPGLLYNGVYAAGLAFSVLIGWPLVGFLVGSVTGDPTSWRHDHGIVRLCSRLTWLLAAPCVIRVVVQMPVYVAGDQGWWSADAAVAVLGVSKLAMGWPLQVAALSAMVWVLARGRTPTGPRGGEEPVPG